MMTNKTTEFASPDRRGLAVFEGLSRRTGKSVAEIRALAAEDKLCLLFDDNGEVDRALSPAERLARMYRREDPDWGNDPSLKLLRLRQMAARWADD